jgi:PAS domain S-box-containing protein
MLDISSRGSLQQGLELERDRICALRDLSIAGTPAEPRFDAITRAASALFQTPMAFMTLIDEDRQWFKSSIGATLSCTPRSISFCTHTIMGDSVMVVPDALEDPRFAASTLVAEEPKIRFYAGAPLVTDSGFKLGALCIADTVPRSFNDEQCRALESLAGLAMNQIVARQAEFSAVALAGLAQSFGQPLLAVGPNGRIDFANRQAADFLGWTADEIQGRPMNELISAGRFGVDAESLLAVFECAGEGVAHGPFRRTVKRRDGIEVVVEISVSKWNTARGAGLAITFSDLAVAQAAEADRLAAQFQTQIATDMAISRRLGADLAERRHPAFFLLAIDAFDELCETLGSHMSDTILQCVAARIEREFSGTATISQTNGAELALVFEEIGDVAEGCRIAERLSHCFDEVFDLGARVLQMTVSIGFAVALDGGSAEDVMAHAALALREVRRLGGGVQMYDDALKARSSVRSRTRSELMQAIKNEEFRLFYQPQVSLLDGRVQGVEALIRWQHPTRGLLTPSDFLADIEEGGLSLPVGWWTLDTACAQLAAWRAAGLPDISIGVNLFPAQLRSDRLLEHVVGALDRHGIEPGLLELEVTEKIALVDDEVGLNACRALRALGVRIAFDDFGTGYASLSSLQRFPLTTLKLDRSFISHILTNSNDAVITRSMIVMANDLGLTTIGEGIETPDQEAFLRNLGCEAGQGYLYSMPVSAEEVEQILAHSTSGSERRQRVMRVVRS